MADEKRDNGIATWGKDPWFDATYKSGGELAPGASQAVQMQGSVNELRKKVGLDCFRY